MLPDHPGAVNLGNGIGIELFQRVWYDADRTGSENPRSTVGVAVIFAREDVPGSIAVDDPKLPIEDENYGAIEFECGFGEARPVKDFGELGADKHVRVPLASDFAPDPGINLATGIGVPAAQG